MKKTLIAAALSTGLIFTVGACSSDSPEENSAAACAAFDSFAASFKSAQDTINGSATVGEIKTARDNLKSSYETFNEALGKVAEDRLKDVESAWKGLDDAVSDLKDDQTVSDATGSLTEELQGVQKAQDDVYAELGCS